MFRLILLAALLLTGCNRETPAANPPVVLRQQNWVSGGQGSCTHATFITALRWQNRPLDANWWKATHGGGESPDSLAAQLDQAGIRYAMTAGENDVAFLEAAIATRRGCGVTVMAGRHMVFLADLTATHAALIDPNATETQWVEREAFLAEWQNSNSWALTPLYSPIPALEQ